MFYDDEVTVERPATGVAIIHCPEVFDVYTAPVVREVHVKLAQEGIRTTVFDLTKTRKLDSTGMGVLVGALKRMRNLGGGVVLDSPAINVRHALTVTGLTKIFHIVEPVIVGSEA